jgi:hypothetical protein
MALAVSVSEVPGAWSVRLTASGATGEVLWVRDEAGWQTIIGTGLDVVDRYAPLNTLLYYIAQDDTANVVGGPITISSDYPVLASSMYGTSRQVTVVAQQPNSWRARSVWHPVLDRADGPVVSIFEAEWREGTMVLGLADRDERRDLIGILMRGDPLILRATCPDRVDDLTILPLAWSDPYITDGRLDSGQRLEVTYQSVTPEPPAYIPPPEWTYGDVLAAHATYSEVLATYATYSDLLAKVPA